MQKCNARWRVVAKYNDLSAKSAYIYFSAKNGGLLCSEFMLLCSLYQNFPFHAIMLYFQIIFMQHFICSAPFFLEYIPTSSTYFSETPKLYCQFFLKIAPLVFLLSLDRKWKIVLPTPADITIKLHSTLDFSLLLYCLAKSAFCCLVML